MSKKKVGVSMVVKRKGDREIEPNISKKIIFEANLIKNHDLFLFSNDNIGPKIYNFKGKIVGVNIKPIKITEKNDGFTTIITKVGLWIHVEVPGDEQYNLVYTLGKVYDFSSNIALRYSLEKVSGKRKFYPLAKIINVLRTFGANELVELIGKEVFIRKSSYNEKIWIYASNLQLDDEIICKSSEATFAPNYWSTGR